MSNIAVVQNELDKLKAGTLLSFEIKRSREPGYVAVDSLTDRSSALSKINQYTSDIEKIKREMNLAHSLIRNLPNEEYLKEHEITSEDYILYHQGYFLELVHQMKDKIIRLLDLLSKIKELKPEEPKEIKIQKVLSRPIISESKVLCSLIKEWNQESGTPISFALKKRTDNHHFRSKLHLNSNYQDIKVSRIFLNLQDNQNLLSDYGLSQMKKRGESGFEKWHKETTDKIFSTKEYVFKNIELMSKNINKIFNLTKITSKKAVRIFNLRYNDQQNKIINNCTFEKLKLTESFYMTVKCIEIAIKNFLPKDIISFYVTGSVARGQPILGLSDLDIVLVTSNIIPDLDKTLRNSIVKPQIDTFSKIITDLNIQILTKEQFLNVDNFKTSFACRNDGLLIYGEDLAKTKKDPSIGLGLSFLLNKDFKINTQNVINYLNSHPDLTPAEINRLTRTVSKNSLRLLFGEVMANHTVYEVEMLKIKELLVWAHPNNWRMVATTYQFLRGDVYTNRASLENIVNELCINRLYPLIDDLENKSKKWLDDWVLNY